MTTEGFDATGLALAGEIETRVMREARVEDDYRNANIAGAHEAYTASMRFAQSRIDAAGPYDDVRALVEFVDWAADKIRAIHSIAMNGTE